MPYTIWNAPSDRDFQDQFNMPEPEPEEPEPEEEDMETKHGAGRSCCKPLYHLVPVELMIAVASTRAYGDRKYEPGDWKKGDKAWFIDCLSHAIEHLIKAGDPEDPKGIKVHLGHAACNIGFILWALAREIVTAEDFGVAATIVGKE